MGSHSLTTFIPAVAGSSRVDWTAEIPETPLLTVPDQRVGTTHSHCSPSQPTDRTHHPAIYSLIPSLYQYYNQYNNNSSTQHRFI